MVLLGPFHSASEVRTAAHRFGGNPSVIRVNQHAPAASTKIVHSSVTAVPHSKNVTVTKREPIALCFASNIFYATTKNMP